MHSWRKQQTSDHLYQKAKQEGYRARSAYKLIEIQEKFRIIRPNSNVIDLGCAPGGWLQVISRYTSGFILGIDLQNIAQVPNTHFVQADFTDADQIADELRRIEAPAQFQVVLSDMSPIISGDRDSDHYQSAELVSLVYEFAKEKSAHYMTCKLFDGPTTSSLIKTIAQTMLVRIYKPKSSRPDSREIYVVARNADL